MSMVIHYLTMKIVKQMKTPPFRMELNDYSDFLFLDFILR